jgi:hypothetical protein
MSSSGLLEMLVPQIWMNWNYQTGNSPDFSTPVLLFQERCLLTYAKTREVGVEKPQGEGRNVKTMFAQKEAKSLYVDSRTRKGITGNPIMCCRA